MTGVRAIMGKATVQALLAVIATLTASAGFMLDKITGESYLIIVVMAFAWAFKAPAKSE